MRVTAADLERLRATASARADADLSRGKVPRFLALEKNRPLPRRQVKKNKDMSLEKLKRAQAPRETAIQRQIIDLLNSTPGIYAWKAGAGLLPLADGRRVRMGRAGVADVVGWLVMHLVRGLDDLPELELCRRVRGCYYPHHVPVFVAVEVKRPSGKPPTPVQLAFLARLKDAGSPLAMVATSVDEVRRAVEAL